MTPEDCKAAVSAWLRDRDEAAARALMRALYPLVIAIVRGHLPRRTSEEDLAQEVFLKMFSRLDQYDPVNPLENWVSRIARNACFDALRAQRRRPELRWADLAENEAAALESSMADTAADTAGDAENAASRELLAKLMDGLSPEDRLVFTALNVERRSVAEVQKLTGWSAANVKVRAFRARLKLKLALAELEKGRL